MKPALLVILPASLLASAAPAAPAAAAPAAEYPEPTPLADGSLLGEGIQRTMALLATSTPQKRNRVRILFYGQSITGQKWTGLVEEDLKARFPHADIEFANLALGGFSSQLLVRTAEYDVYPFYPDLMIFHVYGSHTDYEKIIENTRKRTTTEVLMQSDHVTRWPESVQGSNPWKWPWSENMNRNLLPAIAKKYGCPFVNIRGWWLDYLIGNDLQPKDLLADNVHLNRHGEFLMGRLVSRYLRHNPELQDGGRKGMVKTYEVGKDVTWRGSKLALEFEGNRVDVIAAPGRRASAKVLIDGKKPSEFPELYHHSRPSGTAGVGWPAIKKISWEKPLLVENWTATFSGFNDAQTEFTFTVKGSKTGADGSGSAKERFISNSGRVVIEPSDWVFGYCYKVSKRCTPDGFKVRWKALPAFVDTYEPPQATDAAREYPTTLAQGLANTAHTLELVAGRSGRPAVKAVRVYAPPFK